MATTREKARIIIQSDFNEAFNDGEKAWVSFKQPGEPTVYGDLETTGKSRSGIPLVVPTGKFKVHDTTKRSISLSYTVSPVHEVSCRFQAPDVSFYSVHQNKKGVECLDVTPGGLGVSADSDANLRIWTTDEGQVRRELKGHIGDIGSCRFFPSGVVVLSGAADMRLKVWSAETGQCAATFIGHTGAITDTAIVERGRNIVSVSRDGTARLWDCSTQDTLAKWDTLEAGIINSCALLDTPADGVLPAAGRTAPTGEKEVGTAGKLLLLGCENDRLIGCCLRSRSQVFSLPTSSAVNCVSAVSDTVVVAGTEEGALVGLDLRRTDTPLAIVRENRAAILSLLPHQQGFYATTGDGSCFYITEELDTSQELVGSDCDPVYKVVSDGNAFYTACRDGVIRKYRIG